MLTIMLTNIHISVSVFFFHYRYIWECIVVWKIGCFTRFVAYPVTKTMFHS
jgi:hypothetical protein